MNNNTIKYNLSDYPSPTIGLPSPAFQNYKLHTPSSTETICDIISCSLEKNTSNDFSFKFQHQLNDTTFIYSINKKLEEDGIDDSLDLLYERMSEFLIKKDLFNIHRIMLQSINEINNLTLLTGILTLTIKVNELSDSRNSLRKHAHRLAALKYGSEIEADDLLKGL